MTNRALPPSTPPLIERSLISALASAACTPPRQPTAVDKAPRMRIVTTRFFIGDERSAEVDSGISVFGPSDLFRNSDFATSDLTPRLSYHPFQPRRFRIGLIRFGHA